MMPRSTRGLSKGVMMSVPRNSTPRQARTTTGGPAPAVGTAADRREAAALEKPPGPAGPTLTQLPLFASDAEALRLLHEDYNQVCMDHGECFQRSIALEREHRTLAQALQAKQWELDCAREASRRLLDAARRVAADWHRHAIAADARARRPTRALDAVLKSLLTLVHPDNWSQGQPATALAHELTVAINTLRQHEGRQP
jgi:hypothetical protein